MQKLQVKKIHTDAKIPVRAHAHDAGLDLFSLEDAELPPHEPVKIRTGIAMALPEGHVGLICDRSSMGSKGIRTLGGVVDAGYRGEVQVVLINLTNKPFSVKKWDKLAQMLVLPVNFCSVKESEYLDNTSRGEGGFGSTGK